MKKHFSLKTILVQLVKYSFIFTVVFLLISCSNKNNKTGIQVSSSPIYIDTIQAEKEECYTLPIIPDSIKTNQLFYVLFLTDKYIEDITQLISSNFIMNAITESKVSISTEGVLAYHTLPGEMSVETLQLRYDSIFDVDKIEFQDNGYTMEEPYYYKLSYRDSYIKVHHLIYEGWESDQYQKMDDDNIVCAVIKDEEITLLAGIYIGMSKKDFFYNKLGLKVPLSIDTVEAGCTTGDVQQQFIFRDDTLNKVLITTYYDIADFQFTR